MKTEGVQGAANLLSTPPSELQQPPAEEKKEGQEAPVKQEATPETQEAKQETPPDEGSDTEAKKPMFKVKVDGEEIEVDQDELLKGYSRESHYQKKAKDLAQEREALTSKSTELDAKLADAEVLISDKKAKLDSDELKALRDVDPDAYLREKEKLEADLEKFEQLKSDRQKELDSVESARVAKEQELLFDAYPHWRGNEQAMNDEVKAIYEQAKKEGYSDQDWDNITDHKQYIVLDKARKFDEIDSASLEQKEVKPETKNLEPSAKKPASTESTEHKNAWSKLRNTGKVNDAADVLKFS